MLVGPEGGWSPRELALVENKVSLGDGVLRVETAALAAGARCFDGRFASSRSWHPRPPGGRRVAQRWVVTSLQDAALRSNT